MDFGMRTNLPDYNALLDSNMRNYFENESIQNHLVKTGLINQYGRITSIDRQRTRLRVIENEIARTEKMNDMLQKEEEHVRHLVQLERAREIERQRDLECVARRREEKKRKAELDQAERELLGHAHLYYRNNTAESKHD
eukprot:scaffold7033_cov86-Cyclotella_meneghiniana.AAC.4